jgi:predicted nucleotidyltransferase
MELEELKNRCIIYAYRGSKSHNTYVPSSDLNSIDDIDTVGVYVAPKEYYLGLHEGLCKSKSILHGEWDEEFHEVKRFINLLLKSNPNVMGLLWLKPELYLSINECGRLLINNRDLFSSKKAYASFVGYAHAQLKRMTHLATEGYMGQKRKTLVEKYGFDCKNAAHCLRLLTMGIEFLQTGQMNVWRDDAQKFIDIKSGKWALEEVQKEAAILFNKVDEALNSSALPDEPSYKKAEEILIYILEQSLYETGAL